MNNHRETITGTTVQGEMGARARRTWWVRKQRAKPTREGGGPSGQRSGLLGATAVWPLVGTKGAVALPSLPPRKPWDRRKI